MAKITFDYSKAASFVAPHEMEYMKKLKEKNFMEQLIHLLLLIERIMKDLLFLKVRLNLLMEMVLLPLFIIMKELNMTLVLLIEHILILLVL